LLEKAHKTVNIENADKRPILKTNINIFLINRCILV